MEKEADRFTKKQSKELLLNIVRTTKEYAVENNLDMNRVKHLLQLIQYDLIFETEYST